MRPSRLRRVFGALNDAEVRYPVVGGIAVIAHGYLRTTTDIDLVIGLAPENIGRAMAVLAGLGYRPKVPVAAQAFADAQLREQWINEKGMIVFQMIGDDYQWEPIDVFIREPFPFAEVRSRALWHELGDGVSVPIVPLETLLTMKREAGRDQDRIDIKELQDFANYQKEKT